MYILVVIIHVTHKSLPMYNHYYLFITDYDTILLVQVIVFIQATFIQFNFFNSQQLDYVNIVLVEYIHYLQILQQLFLNHYCKLLDHERNYQKYHHGKLITQKQYFRMNFVKLDHVYQTNYDTRYMEHYHGQQNTQQQCFQNYFTNLDREAIQLELLNINTQISLQQLFHICQQTLVTKFRIHLFAKFLEYFIIRVIIKQKEQYFQNYLLILDHEANVCIFLNLIQLTKQQLFNHFYFTNQHYGTTRKMDTYDLQQLSLQQYFHLCLFVLIVVERFFLVFFCVQLY